MSATPTQIATWASTVNSIAPQVESRLRSATYFLAQTITDTGVAADNPTILGWAEELYVLIAALPTQKWELANEAGQDMITTGGGDTRVILVTNSLIGVGLNPARARTAALAIIAAIDDSTGPVGTTVAIPIAEAAGVADSTTYDNPVDAGKMNVVVTPSDQVVLAMAIEGDAFPRLIWLTDPVDGMYIGDGTFDPYFGNSIEVYFDSAGFGVIDYTDSTLWALGVNYAARGRISLISNGVQLGNPVNHAYQGSPAPALTGGTSSPNTLPLGGEVGDIYVRTDGAGRLQAVYQCTTRGNPGVAVWSKLLSRKITTISTGYSIGEVDLGNTIRSTHSAGNINLTIPSGITGIEPGDDIIVVQGGAGVVSVVAGGGVTITQPSNLDVVTHRRYSVIRLTNVGTDTWVLSGDLAPLHESYNLPFNIQSGSAYQLVVGDAGARVEMTSSSANTVTIPTNATAAFAVGDTLEVVQMGTGQTTIAAAGGVTLRAPGGRAKIAEQYGASTLLFRGSNEWVIAGDLST